MDKGIVFKGMWFLPNNLHDKINGILTYNPDDIYSELELFGHIADYNEDDFFEILLGITLDGEQITLHNCRIFQKSTFSKDKINNVTSSKLKVDFIFNGAHIQNVNDLMFEEIQTEIYNLENWVGIEGFSNVSRDYVDDSYKIDFTYNQPKPIEFKISDKLQGSFRFSISDNNYVTFQKEYKYTQTTRFILNSSDSVSFRDLLYDVYIFQNFLVSALFTHTISFNVILFSDNFFTEHKSSDKEIKIAKPIQLYGGTRKKITQEKPKTFFQMLFTYNDIEKQFPEIISKWYKNHDILSNSFSLFFYQFYLNDKYLDVLFLNLAQAVETFHYHLYPNKKLLESPEFKKRKKLLKVSLTKELYDWIEPQMSNNLYLDIRLSEIIEKYSTDVLLYHIGDITIFKRDIKNTRNYLTHFNPDLEKKALVGNKLLDLYIKLQMLLVSAFLIESGFKKELVNDLLNKNGQQVFPVSV